MIERMPPHDLAAERACLGAVLLGDKAALEALAEHLLPGDFYADAHRTVAEAALRLRPRIVDLVTVSDELRRSGLWHAVGGETGLRQLVDAAYSTDGAAAYVQVVAHWAKCRRALQRTQKAQDLLYTADAEGLEQIGRDLASAVEEGVTPAYDDVRLLGEVALERVAALRTRKPGTPLGATWGFKALDYTTPGLERKGLYILAARPGMGKTGLAMEIAKRSTLATGKPWLFVTYEMALESLADRQITAIARVDGERYRRVRLNQGDWDSVQNAAVELAALPLYATADCVTVQDVRRRAKSLKRQYGDLGGIVQDYLQLVSASGRSRANRQEQVAQISRDTKLLARELDCPIIALSQLSRAVESREDKRPMLSDLRESGAIEQDAEAVLFLYRSDYYNAMSGQPVAPTGTVEVIIGKQRNMPVGTVYLAFQPHWQLYSDVERRHERD